MYWTSIAYLLWDDSDPGLWDAEQRQALIDWLHWGGQIIVSGPDALLQLSNSFLGPYLPATVKEARSFDAHDLEELSWCDWKHVPSVGPVASKPWPGAVLKIDPHAEYVRYTGDLLVERQVGRGRIVVSAFRLTGQELTGWNGFDCMFNACLLRRPAREYWNDREEEKRFRWAESKAHSDLQRLDAAQMTAVRYFARDTGVNSDQYAPDIKAAREEAVNLGGNYPPPFRTMPANGNPINGSASVNESLLADEDAPIPMDQDAAPGLGAWNDYSPVANAARAGAE